MLFYCQMRWDLKGMTFDELWDLEGKETDHAQETEDEYGVLGLYKVAAEQVVIAIVNVPSAEELDRIAFGRLPMREHLIFEKVWALRDYAGFAEDVKKHFKGV